MYAIFCFLFLILTLAIAEIVHIRPYRQKRYVPVNPLEQHIPLPPTDSALRPPPARLPPNPTLFIGISSFRDTKRCGTTLFLAFKRAGNPKSISVGVVDQIVPGDGHCVEEYCKHAMEEWSECRYRSQIRVQEHNADESRGPMYARHLQQKLIRNEDFCLQTDAHTAFTNNWDQALIADWNRTGNEMAVLTHYLHTINGDFLNKETGENAAPPQIAHLCMTIRGKINYLVRNEGASMLINPVIPQLTALYGAGLSFSKCHAETRVPIDPYALRIFDGEEFMRSSHLFTYGYDLYTPSRNGSVLYHNYSVVPHRFERIVNISKEVKERETEMGINRIKLMLGISFEGYVSTKELEKYGFGKVRSLESYGKFAGVAYKELNNSNDNDTCRQLYWVPYEDPTEIEKLLPGWKMYPSEFTNHIKENLRGNKGISPVTGSSYIYVFVFAAVSALFVGMQRARKMISSMKKEGKKK